MYIVQCTLYKKTAVSMCLFDLFDCRIMIDSPMASEAESKEKRGVWKLEPYAGVDYNLTLCRLQHIYHGQPYARVDHNPMPELTYPPVRDLRFGLCSLSDCKHTVTAICTPGGRGLN